eukprot:9418020-Heterocapsa_arctica.AAC.1
MGQLICRRFHKDGKCRFGAACYYAHDAPPTGNPDSESGKGAQQDVRERVLVKERILREGRRERAPALPPRLLAL